MCDLYKVSHRYLQDLGQKILIPRGRRLPGVLYPASYQRLVGSFIITSDIHTLHSYTILVYDRLASSLQVLESQQI